MTDYKNAALAAFGVDKEDLLEPFEAQDPFNLENTLQGFICRQNGKVYGALYITHVNEVPVPQRVFCTPKLRYPFRVLDNGERVYHWPQFMQAQVYDKYDGTNVFCYSYANVHGQRFVSFKTRLTPFLKPSRFGDFLAMWKELLDRYPELRRPEPVHSGKVGMSFEMYGRRNEHLIEYDVDLDVKLLFMVDQREGDILPPYDRQVANAACICDTLKAGLVGSAGASQKLSDLYDQMRADLQATNKKVDDVIKGSEGFVFYGMSSEGWSMWKCKPEMVEAIHWAGGAISYNSIVTTVKNAYESCQDVDSAYVKVLLKEEFSEDQIEKSEDRITKALREVSEWVKMREKLLEVGFIGEKRDVMRALSQHFRKDQMKKVYRLAVNLKFVKG